MSTIVTRVGKGAPLTHAEIDANFENLNTDKYQAGDDPTFGTSTNTLVKTASFELGGTLITATAAEINALDGLTASTAELNLLDGVTATTAELNTLDGITASTAELNLLDGATVSTAEINHLGGVTSGIQAQLDAKVPQDLTGLTEATDIDDDDLIYGHVDGAARKLTPKSLAAGTAFEIYSPDPLRKAVEGASGGRATVHYTAKGQPSYFHVVPKFLCEDIAPGLELGTGTHPAFLNSGVEESEIFIGMYQMSEVDGEGVSQPMAVPKVSINWDASRALIQACGAGFDMMTVWDWAAAVFWMSANGYDMRGNTQYGRHHTNRWETGRLVDPTGTIGDSAGADGKNTLTGSGPPSWRHDSTPSGIADMVGNVWEWLLGMKMVGGRVYLAADNGIPVEASWADTLWDMPSNRTWSTIDSTGASDAVKQALIVPNGAHDPIGYSYTNLTGERFPLRGGNRVSGGDAGPAALALSYERTYANSLIGSRPRFRSP